MELGVKDTFSSVACLVGVGMQGSEARRWEGVGLYARAKRVMRHDSSVYFGLNDLGRIFELRF
jgi:hypothetical protein